MLRLSQCVSVLAGLAFLLGPLSGPANAQLCEPQPEVCDGIDNDCDTQLDEGLYGTFYSVFQQPSQAFFVAPIRGGIDAAAYYGYGTGPVAEASNTPDRIEQEDWLVLYMYEGPDGQTSLGLVFDKPIPPGPGGISMATGGRAQLTVSGDAPFVLVEDDPSDVYLADGGTQFSWDWRAGQTDGAVLSGFVNGPFCLTISPVALQGIQGIAFVNGTGFARVPLDSVSNPITICSQLCCSPSGAEACDGADNDCNWAVDDGIAPVATTCGQGVCAATGTKVCEAGVLLDSCLPGLPTGDDTNCNGIDDDCDGVADDGYVPTATVCGTGSCAANGQIVCLRGVLRDTCKPLRGGSEVCDGLDNDCDGAVDDGLGELTCGIGGCANTIPACAGGVPQQCAPLEPTTEACDGRDNDCDEAVDEDTYGTYFSVFQQPTQVFPVTAVRGDMSPADYYGYGTGPVPASSNTPDGLELEDWLVLFLYEDPNGALSLGVLFDKPIAPGPGGISNATGGHAELDLVDGRLVPIVLDDPEDVYPLPEGGRFAWTWPAGRTDGGMIGLEGGNPFCLTISPTYFEGIRGIAVVDGATMRPVALDSTNPITICSQLCCTETGAEVCDGLDNDCDFAIDEGLAPTPSTCGTGSCAATGDVVCTDGVLVDSCEPGAPLGIDADCDGLDQDCSGVADDAYVPVATTCGQGGCFGTGELLCVDGALTDTCRAGVGVAEVCDGLDNDCDGLVDEGLGQITCGSGGCENTISACRNGVPQVCEPLVPQPEACDGRDNDCDGEVDEETYGVYFSIFQQPTQAFAVAPVLSPLSAAAYYGYGTGAIAGASNTPDQLEVEDWMVLYMHEDLAGEYTLGLILDQPIPAGTPGISSASGGLADVSITGAANPTLIVADDPTDAYFGGDGSRFQWTWPAARTDGLVMGGLGELPFCLNVSPINFQKINGIAFFDGGSMTHVPFDSLANPITVCTQLCCTPTGEEICDGIDNDCDYAIDEDIPVTTVTCGTGPCASTGTLECIDGQLVETCTPVAPTGTDDDCDGIDDDCDGTADDQYAATETTCGAGACAGTGEALCVDGAIVDTCQPGTGSPEVCDGLDNDCDGLADNGLGELSCGEGLCAATVEACLDGVPQTCEPAAPTAELCDAADNDCDGEVDEGTYGVFFTVFQQPTQAFSVGAVRGGVSAEDYYGYDTGEVLASSNTIDRVEREDELVLYMHQDGGGQFSLGLVFDKPIPPGPGGISTGTGGRAQLSVQGANVVPLVKDDPSDTYLGADGTWYSWTWPAGRTDGAVLGGLTDIPFCITVSPVAFVGVRNISFYDAATRRHVRFDSISNPITICTQLCCTPTGDEVCDGIDNDCDFAIDEDILDEPTTCGTGACAETGIRTCIDGRYIDSCEPGEPQNGDPCDGIDNDCDGLTDEDYVPSDTSCGTGVCARTGRLECIDGQLVDTCKPGRVEGTDDQCNARDEDCDGRTDEAYVPTDTFCGTGACAGTGELICKPNGQLVDTCEPAIGTPEVCDGIDNDCNGRIDDGIPTTPTTCGSGACAGSGELICQNGVFVDTCVPGDGTPEVCDGIDNDCNGRIDDGIPTTPTTCGVGVCAATGERICRDGVFVDTCVPGDVTGLDDDCDFVDDDCDGRTDEAYRPVETECGVGECANDGQLLCVDGELIDTCQPFLPETEECWNELDDDCDGEVDENCVADYTWSEFVGTAAEVTGIPSRYSRRDTRAGSIELNYNGGAELDAWLGDPPYAAGIATLRNGRGSIVEQWQLNRGTPESDLDDRGCTLSADWTVPQCWLFVPGNLVEGVLSAVLPTYSAGSNDRFDTSGERIEVSGESMIDFTDGTTFFDNAHETMIVTWDAPRGIPATRQEFRGRFDWDLDGLDDDDEFAPLFRRNWPGEGPDLVSPAVQILEDTPARLTIIVNVEAAMDEVRVYYQAMGWVP